MGKLPRPREAGLYHVASRSNAEEHIFRDDRDYVAGIHILGGLVADGFLVCHQFCFMPTHYHVLGTFEEDAASAAIHRLNRRYASGFNRRHRRRGKVFDGPFAAVAIEDEAHLLWVSQYIAANPDRRPWPYSSSDAPFGFVDEGILVDAFGSEPRWRDAVRYK
jgi:REP element-mobilizing transposase RayT